jgi:nucleotide-binding universal stress UspA family protein
VTDRVPVNANFDGGVLVGVDGSEPSTGALLLAAEEACLRKATLHVLRAWTVRSVPRPRDFPAGQVPSLEEYHGEVVRRTTELVNGELGNPAPCPVEVHAVHAAAAPALIEASRQADMLVVGHRGRGGFAGLLLGSVAEQCVRHAYCPVLVVRPNIS